jgi:hypothetical protein
MAGESIERGTAAVMCGGRDKVGRWLVPGRREFEVVTISTREEQ